MLSTVRSGSPDRSPDGRQTGSFVTTRPTDVVPVASTPGVPPQPSRKGRSVTGVKRRVASALFAVVLATAVLAAPAAGSPDETLEADCKVGDQAVRAGVEVQVNAASSVGADSYRFDKYGEGTFDTPRQNQSTVYFDYDQAGTYRPIVEVYDDETGRSDRIICPRIDVENPENIDIEYDPFDPSPAEEVTFHPSETGPVISYEWRVDGSRVSTNNTFSRVFDPGVHEVRMILETTDGQTYDVTRNLVVDVGYRANFTWDQDPPRPDELVSFDVELAGNPDGSPTYYWDWDGDGNVDQQTLDGAGVLHTFDAAGNHTVRLVVEDGHGARTTRERTLTLVDRTFSTNFTLANETPLAGEPVQVDPSATDGADGAVEFRFDWDGDGSFETTTRNPEGIPHAFEEPGNVTVRMLAVDVDGTNASVTREFTVLKDDFALTLDHSPQWPASGQTTTFDPAVGEDADGEMTYRWDWNGDGEVDATSRGGDPVTHTFAESGSTTVRLVAEDEDGTTMELTREIRVRQTSTTTTTTTTTTATTTTTTETTTATTTSTTRTTTTTTQDAPGFGPLVAVVAVLAAVALWIRRDR